MGAKGSLLLLLALLLSGCPRPAGPPLTDEVLARYLRAYRGLRVLGPGIAERYRGANPPGADASADFARIQAVIQAAGFAGYPEFVQASARIGWALSTSEGQAFVAEQDARERQGEAQLQQAIDDPATPPQVRAELRASLASLRQGYAQNRQLAGATLRAAGSLADRADLEVVLRHRAELEAAFAGR